MGMLVEGRWSDAWFDTASTQGRFLRQPSRFREWVAEGAPNRYHLYVALACPWCHRVLIMRRLKRLEALVSVSVTHWRMGDRGWTFEAAEGVVADTVNGAMTVPELYTRTDPRYTGRATVPVLWDKHTAQIVNNESSDIVRMFGTAFDSLGAAPGDYRPESLRGEIDAINERLYETLCNGVYRAGFATTQTAYDEAVRGVFDTLDWLERHLATREFLVGGRLTEADVRLFPTLVRFDAVYFGLFKCNRYRLADRPAISAYLRRLLAMPAFSQTTDVRHIKLHYYSLQSVNPHGIVPIGPDWSPLGAIDRTHQETT